MRGRKIKKFVTVITLVISLLAVQTLELTAMASTGTPDLTNPSVIVSNFADLQEAINTASDGTVIGIDSLIPVDSPNAILGSEDGSKHVYLVRMNADAYLWLTQISNLTISNITIDGNGSITGNNPMLFVDGTLNLNNSVIQNCSGVPFGAVYVTDNGTLNALSTQFNNNSAVSGGHIENHGTATVSGCSFTNGSAQEFGGAISNARNLTVQNCKIVGNRAGLIGGGIQSDDCMSINQSVIYGNSATYGNDIANTINYSMYANDNLADVMSLYEAEGVTPVEWRYDGPSTDEELNQAGIYNANIYNPQSLLSLVLEGENGGGSDEGAGDTEDGGTSDDNTGADDGTGGTEDSGNTEEPGNTEDDGTTGEDGNTDGTEDTGNTGDSGESEDTGNTEDGSNQDDTGSTEDDGSQDNTGSTEDSGNNDDTGNQGDGGSTTEPDDTEDGGSTGEDSGTTDGSQDNADSGNQDSSTDESGDNTDTGNQDDPTGDTGEDNTQNDGSSDTSDTDSKENVTNNYYDQSSTTTNNSTTEDNSSVTNNTDNYEDKSSSTTTTTTTNNYYTYNTPQGTNSTGKTSGTKTNNTTNSAAGTEQKTGTVSGNSTSDSANMQLPDNLTLDLHGVDVSYEIVDGVPKIVISNDKVTEQAVAEQTEATTRTMGQQPFTDNAINTASVAADSENTSASINWYEIVKMLLLAAILIVVIYKPSAKKGTITAVD